MTREIGRSERIRTSDPLLPKQVRYQTALRSDRVRGLAPGDGFGKRAREDSPGVKRYPSFGPKRRSQRLMRGSVPVSRRERFSSTGRFWDTCGVPSRSTI